MSVEAHEMNIETFPTAEENFRPEDMHSQTALEISHSYDVVYLFGNQETKDYLRDPVHQYLKDIGRYRLLEPDEEIHRAKEIKAANEIKALLDSNGSISKSDEKRIIRDYKAIQAQPEEVETKPVTLESIVEKGEKANDIFIKANLRLVVSVAKKYKNPRIHFLDLVQEGTIGMMRGVEKFDPDKGYKFSTYATWWIRQAVTRAISDQARTVRIPVGELDDIHDYLRLKTYLTQELGHEPTKQEIADYSGITTKKIDNYNKEFNATTISFETPYGKEGAVVGDFLVDEEEKPEEEAITTILQKEVHHAIGRLSLIEQEVMTLRFGLKDGHSHAYREISEILGLKREVVSKTVKSTIEKLREDPDLLQEIE